MLSADADQNNRLFMENDLGTVLKMGQMRGIWFIAAFSVMAACSQPPSMITGMSIDSSEFSHLDCEGLVGEQSRVKSELDQSERLQRMYVAGDIASVLVVGVPPTAVTGSNSNDISRYKGELIAIGRSLKLSQCPSAPTEDIQQYTNENLVERIERILQ